MIAQRIDVFYMVFYVKAKFFIIFLFLFLDAFSSNNIPANALYPDIRCEKIKFSIPKNDTIQNLMKCINEKISQITIERIRQTIIDGSGKISTIPGIVDGQKWLIYSGKPSTEENINILWKTSRDGFVFVESIYGEIECVSLPSSAQSIIFIVSADWCCGSDVGTMQRWEIGNDGATKMLCTQKIKLHWKLEGPSSVIPPQRFRVIKNVCKLRSSPLLNNAPDSTEIERYGIVLGNTLAEVHCGSTGLVTGEIIDSTGSIWLFVILDVGTKMEKNITEGWAGKDGQIAGWLSSKDLEILDSHQYVK